jgi:hypothetical protein
MAGKRMTGEKFASALPLTDEERSKDGRSGDLPSALRRLAAAWRRMQAMQRYTMAGNHATKQRDLRIMGERE